MAEQVDARDLKSLGVKSVPVRFRLPAPKKQIPLLGYLLFVCRGKRNRTDGESPGSDPTAAGGGVKGGEQVAAVDKIEEKRKPEDFIGHRNRMPAN